MKRTWKIGMAVGAGVVLAIGTLRVQPAVAQEQKGERTIELPRVEEKLPEGPGREVVMSACVLCHSTRYITMQPAMGREVWVASVDKMRKVFGAPVTNEQAEVVVDYLVAIRGKKAEAGKP
jgi:cytochrome c5